MGRPLGDPAAFGPSSLEDLGTGRLLVEYRRRGTRAWLRTVNPEARVDHRVVLSDLDPGEVYQVRVTCRDTAGAAASARTTFRAPAP